MIRFYDNFNLLNIEMLKNGTDESAEVLDKYTNYCDKDYDVYHVDDISDVIKSAYLLADGAMVNVYIYPLFANVTSSNVYDDLKATSIECDVLDFSNVNYYGIVNKYNHYYIYVETFVDSDIHVPYLPNSTSEGAGDIRINVTNEDTKTDWEDVSELLSDDENSESVLYDVISNIIDMVVVHEPDLFDEDLV